MISADSRWPALAPGTPLAGGALVVEGELGRGDTGITYAGRQVALDRVVAIKVLAPLGDAEAFAREVKVFVHEARALVAVDHPGVVGVFDVFEADGTAYQVMERLDGESLAARLARGPMGDRAAADLGLAVLDTLVDLHARGRTHGDVRPAHVFLDATRGPVLIDLGAAVRGRVDDARATEPFVAPGLDSRTRDFYGLASTLALAAAGAPVGTAAWNGRLPVALARALAAAKIGEGDLGAQVRVACLRETAATGPEVGPAPLLALAHLGEFVERPAMAFRRLLPPGVGRRLAIGATVSFTVYGAMVLFMARLGLHTIAEVAPPATFVLVFMLVISIAWSFDAMRNQP